MVYSPLFLQVSPVQINLDDLDALISELSPEELEELGRVDPDVSALILTFRLQIPMAQFIATPRVVGTMAKFLAVGAWGMEGLPRPAGLGQCL